MFRGLKNRVGMMGDRVVSMIVRRIPKPWSYMKFAGPIALFASVRDNEDYVFTIGFKRPQDKKLKVYWITKLPHEVNAAVRGYYE